MANRKELPREKRLKATITKLQQELEQKETSLRIADANLENANQQLRHTHTNC